MIRVSAPDLIPLHSKPRASGDDPASVNGLPAPQS